MLLKTESQNSETFTAITRIRLCTVSVLVYANKFLKILKLYYIFLTARFICLCRRWCHFSLSPLCRFSQELIGKA